MAKIHDELEAAKQKQIVIHDDNATPAQVTAAIAKIDAVQPKLIMPLVYFTTKKTTELVKAKAN